MFCALLAKISGERLQDHWSSGHYIYDTVTCIIVFCEFLFVLHIFFVSVHI